MRVPLGFRTAHSTVLKENVAQAVQQNPTPSLTKDGSSIVNSSIEAMKEEATLAAVPKRVLSDIGSSILNAPAPAKVQPPAPNDAVDDKSELGRPENDPNTENDAPGTNTPSSSNDQARTGSELTSDGTAQATPTKHAGTSPSETSKAESTIKDATETTATANSNNGVPTSLMGNGFVYRNIIYGNRQAAKRAKSQHERNHPNEPQETIGFVFNNMQYETLGHALHADPEVQNVYDSWNYVDLAGQLQGPYSSAQMQVWHNQGYFPPATKVQKMWKHSAFVTVGNLGPNGFRNKGKRKAASKGVGPLKKSKNP